MQKVASADGDLCAEGGACVLGGAERRCDRARRCETLLVGDVACDLLDDGLGSLTAEVISALPVAPTVPVGPAHAAIDTPRVYVSGMSA